jgi:hypothetical protein
MNARHKFLQIARAPDAEIEQCGGFLSLATEGFRAVRPRGECYIFAAPNRGSSKQSPTPQFPRLRESHRDEKFLGFLHLPLGRGPTFPPNPNDDGRRCSDAKTVAWLAPDISGRPPGKPAGPHSTYDTWKLDPVNPGQGVLCNVNYTIQFKNQL